MAVASGRSAVSRLPPGLTHPYDASRAGWVCYRHGHTFTWLDGDQYVAVQRGRVVNADKVRLVRDMYPDFEPLIGRRPVVDAIPAPRPGHGPEALQALADTWAAAAAKGVSQR